MMAKAMESYNTKHTFNFMTRKVRCEIIAFSNTTTTFCHVEEKLSFLGMDPMGRTSIRWVEIRGIQVLLTLYLNC